MGAAKQLSMNLEYLANLYRLIQYSKINFRYSHCIRLFKENETEDDKNRYYESHQTESRW